MMCNNRLVGINVVSLFIRNSSLVTHLMVRTLYSAESHDHKVCKQYSTQFGFQKHFLIMILVELISYVFVFMN